MEIEIGRLKGLPASSSYSAITLAFANIIIMEWNEDVECYLDMVTEGGIPEKDRPRCCPHCGQSHQLLHRHGHFHRKVFTLEKEWTIPIFRFFCPIPECKRTVNLIPTFVKKHQQVALDIQEQVIQAHDNGVSLADVAEQTESLPGGGYSEKTLWRWKKGWKIQLSTYEDHVWEWILERIPHVGLPQSQVHSTWGWFCQVWQQIQQHVPSCKNIHFLHWLHRFSQA